MSGCKALSQNEIETVLNTFSGPYALRDKALFLLGLRSGFRIGELLSLVYGDVVQNGVMVDHVLVKRCAMKQKIASRSVVLHPEAKAALTAWIGEFIKSGNITGATFLFQSRNGENRPICRQHYFRILQRACRKAGVSGRIGTHSMRKTFASRVYDKLGRNIFLVQKALGHRNIDSTVRYLSFRQEEVDAAILAD